MKTPDTDEPLRSGRLFCRDSDGVPTRAGDTVSFGYGIPPVRVLAKIEQRGRSLIALTPGHRPQESNLRTLKKYVGGWFRQNKQITHYGHD